MSASCRLAFPGLPWAIDFAVPASPASRRSSRLRQQIVGLRDHGLTWNEMAKQVGMRVSGTRRTCSLPVQWAAKSAWPDTAATGDCRSVDAAVPGSARPAGRCHG